MRAFQKGEKPKLVALTPANDLLLGMAAELAREDVWGFPARGEGLKGGISALLAHLGGEESGAPAPAAPPGPEVVPVPNGPPPSGAARPPTVRLSRVTLEKKGDTKVV